MGARNFPRSINTDVEYLVSTEDWDYFDVEWFFDNVANLIDKNVDANSMYFDKQNQEIHFRVYPDPAMGTKMDIALNFTVKLIHGYYSGIKLDFEYEFIVNGYEVELGDTTEVQDALNDYEEFDREIDPKVGLTLHAKAEDKFITAKKQIQDQFAKVADQYSCMGTASNGEAFYNKL